MKPVEILAQERDDLGCLWELRRHDGHYDLLRDGRQIESTFSRGSEESLADLLVAPFRPARQPVIVVVGLGLGLTPQALIERLPQQKAQFLVAEEHPFLLNWHRSYFGPQSNLEEDERVSLIRTSADEILSDCRDEEISALAMTIDELPDDRFFQETFRVLKTGGLIGLRVRDRGLSPERLLRRAGFETSWERVPASRKGKAKRQHTLWLGRKGNYRERSKYAR